MTQWKWSFSQKIALGYTAMALVIVSIGGVSVVALRSVVRDKDHVITVNSQLLIEAERVLATNESTFAYSRAFLLERDEAWLLKLASARDGLGAALTQLHQLVYSQGGRELLERIERSAGAFKKAQDEVIAIAKAGGKAEVIAGRFKSLISSRADDLEKDVRSFSQLEEHNLEEAKHAASEAASSAISLMIAIAAGGMALAVIAAFLLSRILGRQIGSAVQHIQSSSNELQAAANQQTSGSKEQVASMSEITTTIRELVSTARQIGESAQRVAQIAGETANGARAGDQTVHKAQEAVLGIKRQVDLVVNHMLDLGKKSQQIGAILDITNELAEQTNILAINATIEAAGAGESGKRFAVVADEIRKLADRVGSATKEIRTLIDEVRAAVNSTVMATETGSKAVDAGTRDFVAVAAAFKQIGGMVGTTTEAAREIELSTKQQTTAVEQVNIAVSNVAQAAKESEASSTQVLQTVKELSSLSRDLAQLVQAPSGNA